MTLKSLIEKWLRELETTHINDIEDFLPQAIEESAREGFEAGAELARGTEGYLMYEKARKAFFGEDKEDKFFKYLDGEINPESPRVTETNKDQQTR